MVYRKRVYGSGLWILVFTSIGWAGDMWPQFRGPNGDGISDATGIPLTWSESENIIWKTEIHDRGHSSPVIREGRIWLTTATEDGKAFYVLCIEQATGKILLDKKLFEVDEPQYSNRFNSYASPTPVIEDGRGYVHFGTYGTACLDTKTYEILWQRRDIHCDHSVGPGTSPILYKNKLIFHMDGTDEQYVIALDKKTGDTAWKMNRSIEFTDDNPEKRKAFSTPTVTTINGKTEMISVAACGVIGYDPDSGEELWKLGFGGYSNVWRPVVANGVAFINTGYMVPQLWAVKLGMHGSLDEKQVLWKVKDFIGCRPSPLVQDGLIYVLDDKSMVACLEAASGEAVWNQRIRGNFSASPTYADGRIYLCNQEGKTYVIKPGRAFEQLAENQLDEGIMASPAIVDRAIYIRTLTHLYRIESRT